MTKSDRLIFSRYAFICADGKLRANKITPKMFARLETAIKKNSPPSISLLRRCFRKAFDESLHFETVAKYWHQHQGSGGDCTVKIAAILSVNTDGTAIVICENRSFNAVNFYNLDLQVDDEVYLHNRFIIEKVN